MLSLYVDDALKEKKDVWIIVDARRVCEVKYFRTRYPTILVRLNVCKHISSDVIKHALIVKLITFTFSAGE